MQATRDAASDNSYMTPEVLMSGGLSIFTCLAAFAFMDRGASVYTVAQFGVVLAYFVNNPHFLASYTLLYGDFRKHIFSDPSYLWAAVVVPVALISVLGATLLRLDAGLMAHVITVMYFLTGWHYVKQIFGCVIVASVRRRIFYGNTERQLLLANLFLAWFMSWLSPHTQPEPFEYFGIKHYSLDLPRELLYGVYAALTLTSLAMVWMQFNRYIKSGEKPAPPAVAAVVAIYAWYIPILHHPGFAYLIPFFHSLQYLAIVWMLKRNQICARLKNLKDEAWRRAWVKSAGGYAVGVWVMGMLAFEIVPPLLDWAQVVPKGSLGDSPILVSAILFINIHHYFIDNVIWRSSNPDVSAYLFETSASDPVDYTAEKAA